MRSSIWTDVDIPASSASPYRSQWRAIPSKPKRAIRTLPTPVSAATPTTTRDAAWRSAPSWIPNAPRLSWWSGTACRRAEIVVRDFPRSLPRCAASFVPPYALALNSIEYLGGFSRRFPVASSTIPDTDEPADVDPIARRSGSSRFAMPWVVSAGPVRNATRFQPARLCSNARAIQMRVAPSLQAFHRNLRVPVRTPAPSVPDGLPTLRESVSGSSLS